MMTIDWTASTAFQNALALYRAGDYYGCHEVIEDGLWRPELDALRKQFYQGWLQVAVGHYHAQRGNRVGQRNLWARGAEKLRNTLDLVGLPEDVRDWFWAEVDRVADLRCD